jgi:opacity protein-like surface antigen
MQNKTLRILLATTLLTMSATTVLAAEESDGAAPAFGGPTPYASVGGVFGIENASGIPGGLSNSGGYDLRAGYNFGNMLAAELEWQAFGNFDRDALQPVTNNPEPSLEARMLSLNGRFSPLSGRIQPYGLFGAGWMNVQADRVSSYSHQSSFAMRFGLGVAAYVTERIGVAVEAAYILPLTGTLGGGNSFDIIPITASVFFRFK